MKKIVLFPLIILLTNIGCQKISKMDNKDVKSIDVSGNYTQQTKKGVQEPTTLTLDKNGTFSKTLNLCSEYGEIYGKWFIDNDVIKLKIEKADFEIVNEDKITIFMKISNGNLIIQKKEPDRAIGCDLYINDLYKKN